MWLWLGLAGIVCVAAAAWLLQTKPAVPIRDVAVSQTNAVVNSSTATIALITPPLATTATPTSTTVSNTSLLATDAISPLANATGRLRIAVTPWGSVEVDGKPMGVSPPLTILSLEPGEHKVVVRNSDFAARTFRIKVQAGKTERIAHQFE
jgi:serine/threonine-protein kinase